ncbi:MAG: respiratory nitrate reductase subunit gamma [Thermoleophilia bacterium]
MNWNTVLFLIVPYAVVVAAVVATTYRLVYRPYTVSSLSSQILESRKLFWGSISFHWGLVLVLTGHLAALVVPRSITLWNAVPLRMYLLEATGLTLGLWALAGGAVLAWRRYSDARVRAVTTPADVLVLVLLVVSMVTGVLTAALYAFGSSWFTAVFTPYLWSLVTLRPRPELVADLPWLVKLHAFNFFLLLAAFPFTRLVHIITLPLGYLFRPWQLVIWIRRPSRGAAARR